MKWLRFRRYTMRGDLIKRTIRDDLDYRVVVIGKLVIAREIEPAGGA